MKKLLSSLIPDKRSQNDLPQKAIILARNLQKRATALLSRQEKRQYNRLASMIQNPDDKSILIQMTDQAFRSKDPARAAEQLTHILDNKGIPHFFNPVYHILLKGFQKFGSYLSQIIIPIMKNKMRQETADVILPAEKKILKKFLKKRRDKGLRMNINYLGEALTGERDARNRLNSYLEALQLTEIEVISVKISTIYSQISAIARDHTISILCDRMEQLYRAAAKTKFSRADGSVVSKFVYLDMEEYRDMSITAEVFMKTLDRKGLELINAGMALQAYIPDSFRTQKEIIKWARQRVAAGGAPVTLRIVKGANLEMERFESDIRGWALAPYKNKIDTDANFKKMIQEGIARENFKFVRMGIASHNLFDLSYALVLALNNNALDSVQFEMLEGMANHQSRALFEVAGNLLLYAPACEKKDFIHALGYLIRRLDENTGPKNFLRHALKINVGNPEWQRLEKEFLDSYNAISGLTDKPMRTQNRTVKLDNKISVENTCQKFVNEPDTDFSLPHNYSWATQVIEKWRPGHGDMGKDIPLVLNGELIMDGGDIHNCLDPSRPDVIVGTYRRACEREIDLAVVSAKRDDDGWRKLLPEERSVILKRVADEIRNSRGDLIGAAMADGGKTFAESDPEVSEAVDFVEFYNISSRYFKELEGIEARGRGVVVVISPWNFPIAIPAGGISAALAAGNTVILKPSSDSVLATHELCSCFWRAGVSKKTLQFVPCSGSKVGNRLISKPEVNAVIFTGGTDTAFTMLRNNNGMNLFAETGGKNATIVTALSDRDQVIKNVIHSAFSHSGQKCSATSLLILEEEVYEDKWFRDSFCDAVESMNVGSAWDLKNRIGPLIRPPAGNLKRGLEVLDKGESWAVFPKMSEDNPNLYSPGVKWGVQPGSFSHMTELFGPVLAVMKAKDLTEAISIVNQTGYGLTSGLESLDEREQKTWKKDIRAGNLYINRHTTGAIVLRQPFGGMGKSAFGPGIKAGGPNYVAQLMEFREQAVPEKNDNTAHPCLNNLQSRLNKLKDTTLTISRQEIERVIAAISSLDKNMTYEFNRIHDHFRLIGQDNLSRYIPAGALRIRVCHEDSFFEILVRVCAAMAAGCDIIISIPPGHTSLSLNILRELADSLWKGIIHIVEESDHDLANIINIGGTDRVRYATPERVPEEVREAMAERGLYIANERVLAHGRIELLWYLREQSISINYHRYGNLGFRANEKRGDTQLEIAIPQGQHLT